MKVSGFSIVRNAEKYGYPAIEALRSILPLCDELVVAVGNSEDGTREMIESIGDPKIKIIDTVWDETILEGGKVLALETDKAFYATAPDSDWCIYIQADEVLHEKYLTVVHAAMQQHLNNKSVDGLLFHYLHFWGSYDYVASSSKWYRNEIRVVRRNSGIYSYRDAQGFRKEPGRKLRVKAVEAYIYHYGWVKPPTTMKKKIDGVGRLWGGDKPNHTEAESEEISFDFSEIDQLARFNENHPKVMVDRISKMNWEFDFDLSKNRISLKERVKSFLYRLTGKRLFDYKNYILIK